MGACQTVKKWITKEVQIPVEEFITKAKKQCTEVKKKIEEKVRKPVEKWVNKQERKCKRKKCKWWCLCCNKWFCWIVTLVVKVVTWVVTTVIKWVTYLVCKIVMVVVDVIVKIITRIIKWLVSFVVCLFTDPVAAFKSIYDIWTVDIVEDIVDFAKSLLDDVVEFIEDVERLLDALAESFGPIGTWLLGLVKGLLNLVKHAINIVRGIIDAVQDILFGILKLDWCRITAGITNLGVQIGRLILLPVRVPFEIGIGGPRDNFHLADLRDIIERALNKEFGDDKERIERSIELIGLYSRPMGLPITIDPRSLCIRSSVFLQNLHKEGVIDLYRIAGYVSLCDDKWATSTKRINGKVVYTGTEITVPRSDLELFIEEGPEAVPEFTVYPIKLDNFERYLQVAKRKAYQIGLELSWGRIRDYEITDSTFIPLPTNKHDELFTEFGRKGVGDNLCSVPAVAIFLYESDTLNGLTSWFRPPPYKNPCPDSIDNSLQRTKYIRKSGVSFRDRVPEYVFKYVLIHELGHYFGLCHEGHDGFEYIMFSYSAAEEKVTFNTFLEYAMLSGEPYFTRKDAQEVWRWITQVAKDSCLP